ncbi:Arf family guanine nucleotide exchange factor GEA1 [Nakaseomyces bracarensis]|uniref:Arf family guanine nucleotide exchange factor GEA1 n=1 Tax=Nakaseomyces bracarensis TaxID=273131 RepID=UPI00387102D0
MEHIREEYESTVDDPVSVVVKECLALSTEIKRHEERNYISGVPDLIGNTNDYMDTEESDEQSRSGSNTELDEKHTILILLDELKDKLLVHKILKDVTAFEIIDPFTRALTTEFISRKATILALGSIESFLNYCILHDEMEGYVKAMRSIVDALLNTNFKAYDKTSDEQILLKVLIILKKAITAQNACCLSDSIMYDVLKTTLTMACNSKRSQLLQDFALSSLNDFNVFVFGKLRTIDKHEFEGDYINDENLQNSALKRYLANRNNSEEEFFSYNGTFTDTSTLDLIKDSKYQDPNFGVPVVKKYLQLLLSLLTISNDNKRTKQVKIIGFNLIISIIEICSSKIPTFPALFSIIADPIFEQILFVVRSAHDLDMVNVAMDLFVTLVLNMESHLYAQIELTFVHISDILLDKAVPPGNKPNSIDLKELLLEKISIIWNRKPDYLVNAFIRYDCKLNRMDLANIISGTLCKLTIAAYNVQNKLFTLSFNSLSTFLNFMFKEVTVNDKLDSKAIEQSNDIISQKKRKIEYMSSAEMFNKKPQEGLNQFLKAGFISSLSDEEVAGFLFSNKGALNKQKIGLLLCDPSKTVLLRCYMENFKFKGYRLDEALRIMLSKFRLPGESQQIERIIEMFSEVYSKQNELDDGEQTNDTIEPISTDNKSEESMLDDVSSEVTKIQLDERVILDTDSAFVLSYSLIMLNTDLHNPQIKVHMSFEDYCSNLKGCYRENDFPEWFLAKLYKSIKEKEILMPEEHHGNEQLFKDEWNNLIASSFIITKAKVNSDDLKETMRSYTQFIGAIFETFGYSLIDTFLKVSVIAETEDIFSSSILLSEKCGHISSFYNLQSPCNKILESLLKLTSFIGDVDVNFKIQENKNDEYAQVDVSDDENNTTICVSNESIAFGKNIKAQLAYKSVWNLLSNKEISFTLLPGTAECVVYVLSVLYDKHLLSENCFAILHSKLNSNTLLNSPVDMSLKKEDLNKGILSTFASYIKGDDGPSKEQIDLSENTFHITKEYDILSLLLNNSKLFDLDLLRTVVNLFNSEKLKHKRNYKNFIFLFLVEFILSIAIKLDGINEVSSDILDILDAHSQEKDITPNTLLSMELYKLFIKANHNEKYQLNEILTFLSANESVLEIGNKESVTSLATRLFQYILIEDRDKYVEDTRLWKSIIRLLKRKLCIDDVKNFYSTFIKEKGNEINDSIVEYLLIIELEYMHDPEGIRIIVNSLKQRQTYSERVIPILLDFFFSKQCKEINMLEDVEECLVKITAHCSSTERPEPTNLVSSYYLPVLSKNISNEDIVSVILKIIARSHKECPDPLAWHTNELQQLLEPIVSENQWAHFFSIEEDGEK